MTHPHNQLVSGYAYYMTEEMIVGVLTQGAYASKVRYTQGGIEYEVFVDNEDLIFTEDWNEVD